MGERERERGRRLCFVLSMVRGRRLGLLMEREREREREEGGFV